MKYIKYTIPLLAIGCLLILGSAAYAVIGPEPTAGTPTDYTAPSMLSNIALASDGVKVVITWTDPPESDFYKVEILRSDGGGTAVTGNIRATVLKGVRRYEDSEVLAGQTYLYRFRVSDLYANARLSDEYSVIVAVPAPAPAVPATSAGAEGSSPGAVEETVQSAPSETAVSDPATVETLLARFSISRDLAKEEEYRSLLAQDAAEFAIQSTAALESATVNFMVYGISNATRRLGAGERRALVRDYFATVGRGNIAWEDIEKMATGIKPVGRNLERERAQLPVVLSAWVKMRGRNPNFQDAVEDLAWNTMMYRVRFTRDLEKERDGIAKFRTTFNRLPQSPLDWAAVRALGYVF